MGVPFLRILWRRRKARYRGMNTTTSAYNCVQLHIIRPSLTALKARLTKKTNLFKDSVKSLLAYLIRSYKLLQKYFFKDSVKQWSSDHDLINSHQHSFLQIYSYSGSTQLHLQRLKSCALVWIYHLPALAALALESCPWFEPALRKTRFSLKRPSILGSGFNTKGLPLEANKYTQKTVCCKA
jgi:hypothetical protein